MWQARARNSKSTGMVLLIVSAAFLATSFLAASSSFEIMAIISFIFGVFLISSGFEANVKLIPSAESVLGPLLALSEELVNRGFAGRARYVPTDDRGVVMQVGTGFVGGKSESHVPIGSGLVTLYERELGPLKDADIEYIKTWIPRVIDKGLSLAETAKIDIEDSTAKSTFMRPFIRPLCVREDFNEKVCMTIGCPLVSSVGEVIALSSGKEVAFLGCCYDRLRETSTASFSMSKADLVSKELPQAPASTQPPEVRIPQEIRVRAKGSSGPRKALRTRTGERGNRDPLTHRETPDHIVQAGAGTRKNAIKDH
jgi:hypothetical protein